MIRIVFATIAIGIGVNIPSIRQVIHVGAARNWNHITKKLAEEVETKNQPRFLILEWPGHCCQQARYDG